MTYVQGINYKLETNVTAIKISNLLACSFVFYDVNLAWLSLRISPKFQSITNVPLHSVPFIVQFLLLLSALESSR